MDGYYGPDPVPDQGPDDQSDQDEPSNFGQDPRSAGSVDSADVEDSLTPIHALPKNWKKKCKQNHQWCIKLHNKLQWQGKLSLLFGGHKPPELTYDQIEASAAPCDREFPDHSDEEAFFDCLEYNAIKMKLAIYKKSLKGERAANPEEYKQQSSSILAIGLSVGAFLVVLYLICLAVYAYFGQNKKLGPAGQGRGGSKASKLGSRKSAHKSGKASGIGAKSGKSRPTSCKKKSVYQKQKIPL